MVRPRFFLLAVWPLTLAVVPSARADIAVLRNGMTLKLSGQTLEGDTATLRLKEGGEVTLPRAALAGIVPDEVVEEIAGAAEAPAADGKDIRAMATESARRHGLDPALVLAVIGVESNFQPQAVSPNGAQGLMQLMPGTARELGVADPLDPAANLEGGSRYLSALVNQYQGDLKKALAAYNAGAGAVSRHGGVPPYRETRDYVDRVLRRYTRPQ